VSKIRIFPFLFSGGRRRAVLMEFYSRWIMLREFVVGAVLGMEGLNYGKICFLRLPFPLDTLFCVLIQNHLDGIYIFYHGASPFVDLLNKDINSFFYFLYRQNFLKT
jgi:hypothetical protein